MFDRQYCQDLSTLNLLPLSQGALRRLHEFNVQRDQDRVCLLHLLEWALDNLELDPKVKPVLRGSLESLFLSRPKYALKYLLGSEEAPEDPNDLELSPQALSQPKWPQEASQLLVDRLESVLKADPKYQAFSPPSPTE